MRYAIPAIICLTASIFVFLPHAPKDIPDDISSKTVAVNKASSTPEELVALATRRLSSHPADTEALCARAVAWLLLDRFKESARDARDVLALDPWNKEARQWLIQDLTKLDRRQEALAEIQRESAQQSLVAQIAGEIKRYDYKAAENLLTPHLDAYPRDVLARRLRANLRRHSRSFGPATEDALAAMAVSPWDRDTGLRWILVEGLINESRYWNAFQEIQTIHRQEEAEAEVSPREMRQSGASSAELFTLNETVVMAHFDEVVRRKPPHIAMRWLYWSSRWLTNGYVALYQLLLTGILFSRFAAKRMPAVSA